MLRDTAADDFANNVVRRSDRDMLLKPSLMTMALLLPCIAGFVVAILSVGEMTDSDLAAMISFAAIAEAALIGFMTFSVSRRNVNHLKRDLEWMDSLCGFVEFHGGDASKMRKIRDVSNSRTVLWGTRVSKAFWALLMIILVGLGFAAYAISADDVDNLSFVVAVLLLPIAVLLILQFVLTVYTVFLFPSTHDKAQHEFTKELAAQCEKFGFRVKPMDHLIKRRGLFVHALLLVVTLGLYSVILLVSNTRDMNDHISAQWNYEEDLLRDIVAFEGGTGIEATDEDAPGRISGFVKRLLGRCQHN